ncbi:hypothetical protein GCM10009775_09610 [Microbacterium aoyamense]|uniref:DUF4192 domain-containing protein n=1 Tax=Microbacterium aoyamense TaxID=344166 RepID=A0ABN2PDP6_9MICO|nr:DUF4192 family protein [Microbacterium aoyamense]
MNTIVTAADPADFLRLVPRLIGFRPARSVVAIPFAGTRSLGAVRFDLPDHDVESFAATSLGILCRIPDATAVAWVVYTDEPFAAHLDDALPHRDLMTAIERCANACGIKVHDALCVASDAWGSYLDPACPPSGWPLSDLVDPRGEIDDGPQFSLPGADPAEVSAVADALKALDAAVRVLCGDGPGSSFGRAASYASLERVDPSALAAATALDDLPTFFEDALLAEARSAEVFDTALLAWCFARPMLRDVALSQWCLGLGAGDELLEAELRHREGEHYPARLARHMWGEGERPDPARLNAVLSTTTRVAALTTGTSRAGALAVAAWSSWALGRSSQAAFYARLALEEVPEYGLAEIVLAFTSAGHLPDWAFRRAAA